MFQTSASPGAIIGQIVVGVICDRIGRKIALVATTLLIIIGATIGTAAHGANGSVQGLFWCLTFARGITGIVSTVQSNTSPDFYILSRELVGSILRHLQALAKLPMTRWLSSGDQVAEMLFLHRIISSLSR